MMMPCAKYDALEIRRDAQCAWGVDSNKETKPTRDGGDNGNKDEDKRDPEDPNTIEESVH
jgi:hypothetical protein